MYKEILTSNSVGKNQLMKVAKVKVMGPSTPELYLRTRQ